MPSILWSHTLSAPVLGLALAREPLHLLAWDESRRLTLWDRHGHGMATYQLLSAPVAAAISDNGEHIFVACQDGSLWWFNGELGLQIDRPWDAEPVAVAVEQQGDFAVVSDRKRRSTLITGSGDRRASWETPRALQHVAFVPGQLGIVGAADYGYVAAFDEEGKCLWRDGPLTHVNALNVDGVGETIALACYSAGVQTYRWADGRRTSIPTPGLCRLVALDFASENLLVAHESPTLALLTSEGKVRAEFPVDRAAVAIILGPLGDVGAYAMATGDVTFFALKEECESGQRG